MGEGGVDFNNENYKLDNLYGYRNTYVVLPTGK